VVCFPDNRLGGYQENGSYAWNYYATNTYIPVSATPRLVTVLSADIKTLWSQFEPLLARKFDAATQFESRYWKITYDDGSTVTLPDGGSNTSASRNPIELSKSRPSQPVLVDPKTYLASIYYDGEDGDEEYGEELFPIRGDNQNLINSWGPYSVWNTLVWDEEIAWDDELLQDDPPANVEDAMETYVPRQVTSAAAGLSFDKQVEIGDHPSDQTPAVYFHRVDLGGRDYWCPKCGQKHPGWEVLEYWVYYAANPTSTVKKFQPTLPYPPHEHDWETYWVYLHNGAPVGVRLSAHVDAYEWDSLTYHFHGEVTANTSMWHVVPWSDMVAKNLVRNGTHLVLSCEGNDTPEQRGRLGSHAFVEPKDTEWQDGVLIQFNGAVFQRNGSLVAAETKPWRIFSNDARNFAQPFAQALSPSYFMGDAQLGWRGPLPETAKDMKAPWKRGKWDDPYCWECIYGNGNPALAPIKHMNLVNYSWPYDGS
jgi:hypothetical protein